MVANTGKHWQTLANTGKHWQTLANTGKHCQTLSNFGKHWQRMVNSGKESQTVCNIFATHSSHIPLFSESQPSSSVHSLLLHICYIFALFSVPAVIIVSFSFKFLIYSLHIRYILSPSRHHHFILFLYTFITYLLYFLSPSRHRFILFQVSDIFATYSLHICFII